MSDSFTIGFPLTDQQKRDLSAGLTRAQFDAATGSPREEVELIALNFCYAGSKGSIDAPYAVLLCDKQKIRGKYIKLEHMSDLGIEGDDADSMQETLLMIVHHLCSGNRPHKPDWEIVADRTSGYCDLKVSGHQIISVKPGEGRKALIEATNQLAVGCDLKVSGTEQNPFQETISADRELALN